MGRGKNIKKSKIESLFSQLFSLFFVECDFPFFLCQFKEKVFLNVFFILLCKAELENHQLLSPNVRAKNKVYSNSETSLRYFHSKKKSPIVIPNRLSSIKIPRQKKMLPEFYTAQLQLCTSSPETEMIWTQTNVDKFGKRCVQNRLEPMCIGRRMLHQLGNYNQPQEPPA